MISYDNCNLTVVPVATTPAPPRGYDLYYLNVVAGTRRTRRFNTEPVRR